MKRTTNVVGCVVAFAALTTWARAGLLDQLYNTGVDNSGAKLNTAVATVDTHYGLVSVPSGFSTAYAVDGFQTGQPWQWLPSSSDYSDINGTYLSEWISPIWDNGQAGNVGNYLGAQLFNYTINFDLGTATSADIKGQWMADNGDTIDGSILSQIFVNGKATGQNIVTTAADNGWGPFQQWQGFELSGNYFQPGANSITFSVVNWPQGQGNPTGLRVVFTSAAAVPEPFAFSLIALGAGLVRVVRRRRAR